MIFWRPSHSHPNTEGALVPNTRRRSYMLRYPAKELNEEEVAARARALRTSVIAWLILRSGRGRQGGGPQLLEHIVQNRQVMTVHLPPARKVPVQHVARFDCGIPSGPWGFNVGALNHGNEPGEIPVYGTKSAF